jgi:signal transduction histidine kinase
MKRTAFAVLLASAAVGLLVSLALASRSLPIETHIAQYTAVTELERVSEDFTTLVAALESAWDGTQAPGEGARALAARIAASHQQLPEALWDMGGSSSQQNRVSNSLASVEATVDAAATLAAELIAEQTAYAQSVDFLRDSGPRIIEQMRDIRLDRIAADTFQLVVGTLDFARPDATVREFELRRLLVTLSRDQRVDANMPADVERLRNAVGTILNGKANIRSKLTQLAGTPLIAVAGNLGVATRDLYQSAVRGVEQARTMLAVYAVVLLAALGFIAFRLHGSYREINRANIDLALLNESLEQRVVQRTEELAGTLADLKESQVQLVQAEKMSSLGQLVAGISHEINTPLLYLTNNAELIHERLELMQAFIRRCIQAFSIKSDEFQSRAEYQTKFIGALKDVKTMLRDGDIEANLQEAEDLAKDSIEGLGELSGMAQSLKDFSRLDRAPIGSFDVNAGLDKTLLIAKNTIKHKADVRKFYGDLPEIECSPSQINQVFLNIVTNAAQAMDQHGEIVISTALHDDRHVAIRFADTGCGISTEHLGKIRDPFFTTKEVGAGTGLGLSIVDEIIRSHGGDLLVESEIGKGSVFTVILPIKRPAEAADGVPLDLASAPAPERMADDDRTSRSDSERGSPPEPLAEAV